ncbi:CBO0543 family protein, partial [Neobacillus drentensis]|uniref:CBO0543 family protein n=1 Tax=Neobacillus drentensis TaxID=220684 RepID=UPI00300153B0
MSDPRIVQFDKAVKLRKESTDAFLDYWRDHALYASLEYWIMVAILVVPLIFLVFKIDKHKLFLITFYGYTVHVIAAYIDLYAVNSGLWNYPFQVVPFLPSFSIDSSIIPVAFMLVYQWTLNHKKNYYVFSFITSTIFAFIF